MSEITASLVKELREKTGAGMMDCKKALVENGGDMEAAVDWLRQKGLASAAKKAGRAASEGLVVVTTGDNVAAAIELNAETDFVSRNEQFQTAAGKIAELALETSGDVEALKKADMDGKTVEETVTDLIANIGENMNLRRSAKLEVENGVVASYVHGAVAPDMGKIGVLVAIESTGDKDKLNALGKQIAMHIAATRPEALSSENIDQELVERERSVLIEQAKESGKPQEIAEKMVEGRMRKWLEEVVLLEQAFVMDTDKRVKEVVADLAKDLGTDVTVVDYVRLELGDGVEKKEENFAEEVAKMAS